MRLLNAIRVAAERKKLQDLPPVAPPKAPEPITQPSKPKPMFIIDVSHHNGVIDWKKAAAHVLKVGQDSLPLAGAIIKSTEGATVRDKMFWKNVDGCVENGLLWGAYHFATWNDEDEAKDAASEARFFLSIVNAAKSKPSLPLVLDIESNKAIPYTKQEMVVYVGAFLNTLKNEGYDGPVAIYGSPGFLNSYLPKDHPFAGLPLWVADYTGAINPVPGWTKVWLHQYTDKGKVPGMKGDVDLNREITPLADLI